METEFFDSDEAITKRLILTREKWGWLNVAAKNTNYIPAVNRVADVDQAIALIPRGWPEQAKRMSRLENDIFAQLTNNVERYDPRHVESDGQAIDIAAFVAGEPEHWLKFESSLVEGQSNQILKIAVNIGATASITQTRITARGTTMASLIEALEFRGHRCEVWVCGPARSGMNKYGWFLKVKTAEQPLNLASLLFWTAHPAVTRRIDLALCASTANPEKYSAVEGEGFGSPIDVDDPSIYDVYAPAAIGVHNSLEWENNKIATRWLKERIAEIEQGK